MRIYFFLTLLFLTLQYCSGRIVFGILDGTNRLIKFDSATPQRIISNIAIAGLSAGEVVLGGDIRPINGRLYIVTSSSSIYILNTLTGAVYGGGSLLNGCTTPNNGIAYSVDFNPQADRLRIISSGGVSLRVNVDDFTCITDSLNTNTVFQVAYSNNVRNASSTILYAITATNFGQINTPNTGVYANIGPLGFTTTNQTGLDSFGNDLWASLNVNGVSSLYTINPTSGAATLVGQIGNGVAVRSIVISFSDIDRSFIGLNNDGNIVRFEGEDPTSVAISAITGLTNEFLLGVDFRPANGNLYAVSNSSRIYIINPLTFNAVQVGNTLNCSFEGRYFGVDWNPQANLLRVITDSGANYRINVDTSACLVDGRINGGNSPLISSVAYSNNFDGTTSTDLYAIDYNNDALATINPPNNGVYNQAAGPLGPQIETGPATSFDIFGVSGSNTAVGFLEIGGSPYFVTFDLSSGAASLVSAPPGPTIRSLSAAFSRLPFSLATYYPDIVVLTSSQTVYRINSANPGTNIATLTLSGLPSGVTLLGMDIRPATNEIIALGSDAYLYIVALTGIVYQQSLLNCSSTIVSGRTYSVDFNPVADRLRIVSDAGDNLRVNTANGDCLIDGNLAYTSGASGTPDSAGVAYTNSVAGASSTAEYILDQNNDNLAQVTNPNGGQTAVIGSTGIDIENNAPFDVLTVNGQNYGFAVVGSSLYDVALGSGAVRSYGQLSVNNIIGMIVIPQGYVPPAAPNTTTTGTVIGTTSGVSGSTSNIPSGSTSGSGASVGTTTGDASSGASSVAVCFLFLVASFFVFL